MRTPRLVVILVLGLVGAMVGSGPAWAATTRHVSPSGSDVGLCVADPCKTIGYAIGQSSSGDTIAVAAGTYAEHVVVDRSLTLRGAGAGATIVDGSKHGTVITIGAASVSLTVEITRLTIQNGKATTGAGISSVPGAGQSNALTLKGVAIIDNRAAGTFDSPAAIGGGIYNGPGSTLILDRSAVEGNSARGFYGHGGTPAGSGVGGGIHNAGTLVVSKSTVAGNSARGGNGCTRLCNASAMHPAPGEGGGIDNAGSATITQSTLSVNEARGGDVLEPFNFPGGPGSGGGIEGGATLVNSTVSRNSALGGSSRADPGGAALGGGIDASAAVLVTNSTIAGNKVVGGAGASAGTGSGGGIAFAMSGSATLTNTILAGNKADSGPDCFGTVSSGGHNLVRKARDCQGFTASGDLRGVDPLLGPLQDNGGQTSTMALMAGSPGIDAGDDSVCAAPPVNGVDQRGAPRPGASHCDMGAFEVQP